MPFDEMTELMNIYEINRTTAEVWAAIEHCFQPTDTVWYDTSTTLLEFIADLIEKEATE